MAEMPDKEGQTEQATEKRLRDAIEDGNVPNSREVSNLAFLVAAAVAVAWLSGGQSGRLVLSLGTILQHAGDVRLETGADFLLVLRGVVVPCLLVLLPLVLIFAISGVGATAIQNKPAFVAKRIFPDFSRIKPTQGLKRLLSPTGLIEFGKMLVRLTACTVALFYVVVKNWDGILSSSLVDPRGVLGAAQHATVSMLAVLCAISIVMVVFEVPVGTLMWRRSLRMSMREVKDERRQLEGDPHVKGRRRSMARSRARRRLKHDVSRATVIIANPTHFAVALRYVRKEGGAPKVVAKGQDIVALTIRRFAEEQNIPVIEDKALARSLYKKVAVDQSIPVEFYRVIAEILIKLQNHRPMPGLAPAR